MELSNPLLLTVKMFLADVRSWRLDYKFPSRVCTDFAKLIFDAATVQGMRCGYAIVHFEGARTSHAVVAFETDYGLIYIEPQTGELEDIRVGAPYPGRLEGVPGDCVVSSISIMWNDEHQLKFIRCSDCGYLLPIEVSKNATQDEIRRAYLKICCPVCGRDNISFSD